jgi:rhamnosyltransferase
MDLGNSRKICAGIVTYNPDLTRLKDNYMHLSKQVDFVVVCDNGSKNVDCIKELIQNSDAVISLNENRGIAYALNKLCEYAKNKGYKWILTMDQDSVCPDDMVEKLVQHCDDNAAIVGPRILYRENEAYSAKYENDLENVDWVITSGSLTNTDVWGRINGFDNLLFIDKVDTDYGIRANKAGYKVVRDNTVVLNHELGKLHCKRLLGRTIYVTNHNPMRIYYQCRNTVYLGSKIRLKNPIAEVTKIFLKILFYETEKMNKIKKVFQGVYDGCKLIKNSK